MVCFLEIFTIVIMVALVVVVVFNFVGRVSAFLRSFGWSHWFVWLVNKFNCWKRSYRLTFIQT